MKLRSRNITKYEDLDLIIDELLYILNTINKETKLEYRIYKTAELFELIISNKELILENNKMEGLFKAKLNQLTIVGIDRYSKENMYKEWKGTTYYYNNLFNN